MTEPIPQIREIYLEAFRWFDAKRSAPVINVTFYPYIGINHTIRVREGVVYVRIGEVCREMPLPCHKGLAYILVGKLLRKKIPSGAREVYNAFIKSDFVREKATSNKAERGRKVVTTTKGTVYDLDSIFDTLNRDYFSGKIPKPTLTWSARKTYRILGHHDGTLDHITISRSLDSIEVPRYVVDHVVFHEMLHIAHPVRIINGRRYIHTPAFKRDEEKFQYHDQANRWIEQNIRRLKRAARR